MVTQNLSNEVTKPFHFPSIHTSRGWVMNEHVGLRDVLLKALPLTIVLMSVTNVTNGTEVEMNEEL